MHFNPLAPYGARPSKKRWILSPSLNFNPLAPYGARRAAAVDQQTGRRISIHSPRTGRDRAVRIRTGVVHDFNPLAPYGARPTVPFAYGRHTNFNPLAPYGARRFCDIPCLTAGSNFNPLAPYGARPPSPWRTQRQRLNFNPLAPYGARRGCCVPMRASPHFNPLAPYGARPPFKPASVLSAAFQSTRPVRGET